MKTYSIIKSYYVADILPSEDSELLQMDDISVAEYIADSLSELNTYKDISFWVRCNEVLTGISSEKADALIKELNE